MATKGHMNQRQWIPISESLSDNVAKIKRLNVAIVATVTTLSFLVGFIVSQWLIIGLIGLVVSMVFVLSIMRSTDTSLLNRLDYIDANERDHARLINVVDGLCVVSGDRRPHLHVINESYPVAFAVASLRGSAHVFVSSGVLSEMDRVEIEAVMAHVLWRLRSGNVALTCYLLALSTRLNKIGLKKLSSIVNSKLYEDKILMWSDISACQATRYPPGLISALQKCNRTHHLEIASFIGPLLFVDPKTAGDDTTRHSQFSIVGFSAVSVEERLAVLKEI